MAKWPARHGIFILEQIAIEAVAAARRERDG
jgi:hypothetical protein